MNLDETFPEPQGCFIFSRKPGQPLSVGGRIKMSSSRKCSVGRSEGAGAALLCEDSGSPSEVMG